MAREGRSAPWTGLVDDARAGRGGLLAVLGELGIGKSHALRQAVRCAEEAGLRVVRAQGDALERDVPMALVGQILELDGWRAPTEDATELVLQAGMQHVERLAEQPTLIAIDDLHWADPLSLRVLAYVCRRIAALPVAVVATLRPWPPDAERTCRELAGQGTARIERMRPLSRAQVAVLLAERLGRTVTDAELEAILDLCAGNPLLLEEVSATLARHGGGGEDEASMTTDVLSRVAGAAAGFTGLPPDAVLCAQAACVFGTRFRPEMAIDVAQLGEADGDVALDVLWRAGLVRQGPGRSLEFVHPLVQRGLYQELSPPLRSRLHARAFAALARRGFEVRAADHAVRANLAGSAEAIALLSRVGRAAMLDGAVARAAEHFRVALELAGDHADDELRLALCDALLAAGRPVAAASVLERLLRSRTVAAATRAQACRLLGRALAATGRSRAAVARFAEAAAICEADDPAQSADDLAEMAAIGVQVEGVARSLLVTARARELAASDPVVTGRVGATDALLRLLAGDPSGFGDIEAAAHAAVDAPLASIDDNPSVMALHRTYAAAATFVGRLTQADWHLETVRLTSRDRGSMGGLGALLVCHADTLSRMGRLDAALEAATAAVTAAEGAPGLCAAAHAIRAHVLLHLDRLDDSASACAAAEALLEDAELPLTRLWIGHVRGQRATFEGDVAAAAVIAAQVEEVLERLGIEEPGIVPWMEWGCVAYLRSGRAEHAASIVARLEMVAARSPHPWSRVHSLIGRAMLAEEAGDHATAEAGYGAAIAVADQEAPAPERIVSRWRYGAYLRRAGRRVDARAPLRDALAQARTAHAALLARQVAEELRVTGGGLGRGAEGDPLTPQEKRVVELAAAGRSNREIGKHLWLSVNTVETHLQHAYAKLGVRTRRELVARLATDPENAA